MKHLILAALLAMPVAAVAAPAAHLPDPYGPPQRHWAHLPGGQPWGASAGIETGPDGSLWAISRCGANSCDGSSMAAVYQLDPKTGTPLRALGAGMFAFPHGLHIDRQGNIWVTDPAVSKNGKMGEQVIKMSPTGKVLLRLGQAGKSGGGAKLLHDPGDVITAPDGDIFVCDGHGTVALNLPSNTITRVIKFTPDGKFIKAWGSLGSGKSQFRNPHALAFDSKGRLFVADRVNGRIQVFDQNGNYLTEYHAFNHPSGLFIDRHDRLYAVDYNSEGQKGIYIGDAATGKLEAFVPDDKAGEGVTVGPDGTIYEATPDGITRFQKK